MYAMNEIWMAFYEELDPQRRTQMYQQISEKGDDGLNAFRKKLTDKRYNNPKDPDHLYPYDLFLQQCVVLPVAYRRRKFLFTNVKKQAKISAEQLFLTAVGNEGERAALYWELRNTARRYFSTCHGEKYAKSKLSREKATRAEQTAQMIQEAWRMSRGVAEVSGMQKEYEVFGQALRDELELIKSGYGARFDAFKG